MFTRFTAVIILSALLCSNFTRFFVYAGFEINQKYIAENLCINKSRPWMHCNGRCYFMKKIKQAEEDDKKQERQNEKNRYQEALPVEQITSKNAFEEPGLRVTYPRGVTPKIVQHSYSILLPPKVV